MFKMLLRISDAMHSQLQALAEVEQMKNGQVEANKNQVIRGLILEAYQKAVEAGDIIEQ